MNPFQAMKMMGNPAGTLMQQLQGRMNQMAQQNPQAFQKMQEMTTGKSEDEMRQVAMNLAQQKGIDIRQFASQFGIKL